MSVSTLDASDSFDFGLDRGVEWWDPDTECISWQRTRLTEPQLWAEYLRGAQESYCRHGVERALDLTSLRNPGDTSLFLAALDQTGQMVAGVRAKGPSALPTNRTRSSSGTGAPAWTWSRS